MNDLNSLLLEGKIVDIGKTTFTIESTRRTKNTEEKIQLMADPTHAIMHTLSVGCRVRAVGRLAMIEGALGMVAEHVELRPLPIKD